MDRSFFVLFFSGLISMFFHFCTCLRSFFHNWSELKSHSRAGRRHLRQMVLTLPVVSARPDGGAVEAQMMPYWASSCSSKWLKASQGQMTVMSRKKTQQALRLLHESERKHTRKPEANSPVPKPSIPGMSSPNLPAGSQTIRVTNKNYQWGLRLWSEHRATQNSPLDSLLWRLALKLTGLPLLELGGPLSRGGGSSADPRGRLDLSFGLEVHCKQVTLCLTSQERGRRGAILEAERRQKSAKLTHRRQKKRQFSPI